MNPAEIKSELYRLTRPMHESIVARADSEKWADRNAAALAANAYCYKNVPGWQGIVTANVTAAIRSINKEGPWDTRNTAVVMAAAEDWTVGQLAKSVLKPAEFEFCTGRLQPALDELANLPIDESKPLYRPGAANVDKAAGKTSPKKRQAQAVPVDDAAELRALAAEMVAPAEKPAAAEATIAVDFDDLFGDDDPIETAVVETAAAVQAEILPAVTDDFELLLESA